MNDENSNGSPWRLPLPGSWHHSSSCPPFIGCSSTKTLTSGIAQNLTRAPIAKITLLGGPYDTQVSTYHKEPPGWPVLLSLIFMATGRSESVAVIVARLFFAFTIAVVYQLARQIFNKRQALVAAVLFGAAPACFWFSPSTGTDIPAALAAALGMWGLLAGNGMLAAADFALAAQMRLELIILVPIVWLSPKVSSRWKWIAAALVIVEVVHIGWVISIAPALAAVEKVRSAFGFEFVPGNLKTNLAYLFNPLVFPAGITILAVAKTALSLHERTNPKGRRLAEGEVQILMLFTSTYSFTPAASI